jgi:hypothetical protein
MGRVKGAGGGETDLCFLISIICFEGESLLAREPRDVSLGMVFSPHLVKHVPFLPRQEEKIFLLQTDEEVQVPFGIVLPENVFVEADAMLVELEGIEITDKTAGLEVLKIRVTLLLQGSKGINHDARDNRHEDVRKEDVKRNIPYEAQEEHPSFKSGSPPSERVQRVVGISQVLTWPQSQTC